MASESYFLLHDVTFSFSEHPLHPLQGDFLSPAIVLYMDLPTYNTHIDIIINTIIFCSMIISVLFYMKIFPV